MRIPGKTTSSFKKKRLSGWNWGAFAISLSDAVWKNLLSYNTLASAKRGHAMKRPTHMAKLLIPFLQLHLLLTACAPQTPTLPSPTSSPGQAHEADAKPVPAQGSLESSLTFLQNAIQEILAQVTAGQSEPEAAAREINRQVEQVQMQTKDTRLLASSVDSAFSKQLTTPNDTRALLEVLERLQTLSAHLQPQQGPD
ncbi:MAG: hypothetical protein ACAI44_19225, partial [Candidatus Sericytochromatia bacterium]